MMDTKEEFGCIMTITPWAITIHKHPQTKGWGIGLGLGSGVWVGEGKGSELASDSKCPRTHLDERGQM